MFFMFSLQVLYISDLEVYDFEYFRFGYFGLVFDLAFQTCKYFCMYIFLIERLSSILYYQNLTYDHVHCVH